jgi:hypothetical protein
MGINLTIALDMIVNNISGFKPDEKYEIQLTNAEMIREAAAIIANSSDEAIIDALKEIKKRER